MGPVQDLKTGKTCSQDCEDWLWDVLLNKFLNNTHALRYQWLWHVSNQPIAHTDLLPACGEHSNFFSCLFDTLNTKALQSMLDNPGNNKKARRERHKDNGFSGPPPPVPTFLDGLIYEIYGGVRCPGKFCLRRNIDLTNPLSQPTFDQDTDLLFCSPSCATSHERLLGSYHKIKNNLVLQAIASCFGLILDPRMKPPKVSPLEKYHKFLEHRNNPPPLPDPQTPLADSQMIMSFNIGGSCNLPRVKAWIKKHKPAIVGLQELKFKSPNTRPLMIPGYVAKGLDPDTCIIVRNDLKILEHGSHTLPFSNCFVKIQGPDVNFSVTNVYIRDGELTSDSIYTLENFSSNHLLLGDFNAKHPDILPHTQKIKINDNGKILHQYRNSDRAEGGYHIENRSSDDEYTHMSHQGGGAQIDLILSSPDLEYRMGSFKYFYELCSDHIAIAVTAPGLVHPLYQTDPPKIMYDWNKFDRVAYRELSHALITDSDNDWDNDPIEDCAEKLEYCLQHPLKVFLPERKLKRHRDPLPPNIVEEVKEKRQLLKKINRTNAEYGLLLRHKENLAAGVPTPPNQKPAWPEPRILDEYHHRNPNRRIRIKTIRKNITETLKEKGIEKVNRQLERLSNIPFHKASQEWWAVMNNIKAGKSPKTFAPVKYKESWATEKGEIANLVADYAEDNFRPIQDPKFNQARLDEVNESYRTIKDTILKDGIQSPDPRPFNLPKQKHPYLKGEFSEKDSSFHPPALTNHQKSNLPRLEQSSFRKRKLPIPGAQSPNVAPGPQWRPVNINGDRSPIHRPFTMGELDRAINKQPRKAPGIDGIYSDAFKNLSYEAKHCILKLYNRIRASGHYPARWKIAVVVMILKKDKAPDNPKSYRPISLLALAGKIFETMLLDRLIPYLENRNLIPSFQTGFRKNKSTMINLQRFMNGSYLASTRATNPTSSIMMLLDCMSAFDTVPHEGVVVKAFRDGLALDAIKLIDSWLSGRTLKIRVSDALSKTVSISAGVPQGSVLSPLIWDYWVGDCPTPSSPHVQNSMYADDMALIATHPDPVRNFQLMQEEIYRVVDWANAKGIKMVQAKTQLMVTHPDPKKRKEMKENTIHLQRDGSEPLEWNSKATFLGITFAETGSFAPHFRKKLATAYAKIRQLKMFAGKIDSDLLYRVYKGAIEPVVLYGAEVLYPVLSDIATKDFLQLEFAAIRTAYAVSYDEFLSNADLHLMKPDDQTVWDRIDKRRTNFVRKNFQDVTIRNSELSVTGEGRTIRFKEIHVNPHTKGKKFDRERKAAGEITMIDSGWYNHRPITLFVDTEVVGEEVINVTNERKQWAKGCLAENDATKFPASYSVDTERSQSILYPPTYIPAITMKWSDPQKSVISVSSPKSFGPTGDPMTDWKEHAKNFPRNKRRGTRHRRKSKPLSQKETISETISSQLNNPFSIDDFFPDYCSDSDTPIESSSKVAPRLSRTTPCFTSTPKQKAKSINKNKVPAWYESDDDTVQDPPPLTDVDWSSIQSYVSLPQSVDEDEPISQASPASFLFSGIRDRGSGGLESGEWVQRDVQDLVDARESHPSDRDRDVRRDSSIRVVRHEPIDQISPEFRLRQQTIGTMITGFVVEQFPHFARIAAPGRAQPPLILSHIELGDLQLKTCEIPDPPPSSSTYPVDPDETTRRQPDPGYDQPPSPNWKERNRSLDPGIVSSGQAVGKDAPLPQMVGYRAHLSPQRSPLHSPLPPPPSP